MATITAKERASAKTFEELAILAKRKGKSIAWAYYVDYARNNRKGR